MDPSLFAVVLVVVTAAATTGGTLANDHFRSKRELEAANRARADALRPAKQAAILEFEDATMRYREVMLEEDVDLAQSRHAIQRKAAELRLLCPELAEWINKWLSALTFGHPDEEAKNVWSNDKNTEAFFRARDAFEAAARRELEK